jgi:hypothetical protein
MVVEVAGQKGGGREQGADHALSMGITLAGVDKLPSKEQQDGRSRV